MRTIHAATAVARRALVASPKLILGSVGVLAVLMFASAGALAWFSYDITAGLPDREEIRGIGDMAQSTTIYDADDAPVFTIFKEQRIEVPLERISRNLIAAVVSVEDQRFFEHSGVDTIRIGAAALRNFREGRRAEGGSTITQQLARQTFLSRDKTYRRKLKEIILAAYLESLYSKQDILSLYLNKVYFGDGLYGVEAASRGYFGKSAADLSVDEAALLAGLIQSPSSYAPTVNLERAVNRRNVVLQTMVSSGAITQEEAERARTAEVKLENALEIKEHFGLYFKEHVRRELVERFGWQRVYQGGLRVYTTLKPELQNAAEAALEQGLKDVEKRRGFKHAARGALQPASEGAAPDYLQGALVAIDPSTGHVLAMVGGREFGESRFNRAVQARRQAGSAFKPFVFAAALEAGYSPASLITGLNDPIPTLQGAWLPDDEHSTATSMTLRSALRTSSNRAAVQLLNAVGIPRAVGYAEKLNVGTPPSVPSLALGSGEVTLVSLTAAYGAFANKGVVRTPVTIRRVEDTNGTILYEDAGRAQKAVSEATAFLMASMLSDVVNAGTGYRARQIGFTLPAAGKTGTTNDYNDAWFVGFTPKLVTGVWIGFDQPRTIIPGGYAGDIAVPVWATFMKTATRGARPEQFERPSNVIGLNVCRLSGQLPNDGCASVPVATSDGQIEHRSMIYTEFFVRGTQPNSVCPMHGSPSFMDRLAGIFGKDVGRGAPVDESALPAPAPASTTGSASPARSAEGRPPASAAEPREEPGRRGFWSRLFGVGGDDRTRAEKEEARKKEEERRKQEERKEERKKEEQRKKEQQRKKPGGDF